MINVFASIFITTTNKTTSLPFVLIILFNLYLVNTYNSQDN